MGLPCAAVARVRDGLSGDFCASCHLSTVMESLSETHQPS